MERNQENGERHGVRQKFGESGAGDWVDATGFLLSASWCIPSYIYAAPPSLVADDVANLPHDSTHGDISAISMGEIPVGTLADIPMGSSWCGAAPEGAGMEWNGMGWDVM